MFATQGFQVRGVDVNPRVVSSLQSGRVHIEEPGLDTVVKAALSSGRLVVSDKIAPADVFIIAVPTPYHHDASPVPNADMSYVKSALDAVLSVLVPGNLVILESTSPPGTTLSLLAPEIQKKGLRVGVDVGLAYCPERVIPGKALKELIENDRVVGAVTPEWGEKTRRLYKSFVSGEVFVTTPTVAEMVKVAENTFRDVNIALANELATICEKLEISVWDVVSLANRHPRVNLHRPGPGVGGHCISVDPWFLVEMFPKEARLIRTARTINDGMPARVVAHASDLLSGERNPKIAILGLAYKGNVDDVRESPALVVVKGLGEKHPGGTLMAYDPHVKTGPCPMGGIREVFQGADLAVLLTSHDEYRFLDPVEVGALMRRKVVFDAHNFLDVKRWRAAGFRVITLGTADMSVKSAVPSASR